MALQAEGTGLGNDRAPTAVNAREGTGPDPREF